MRSVPQSDISQSAFLWSRDTAARETLRYLDRNGIDAEPLLVKAELSRGQLSLDSGGISVASQHRFLEFAAIETNDPLLGLHVAAEMDLGDAGILIYLSGFRRRSRKLSNTSRDMRERRTKQSTSKSRSTKVKRYWLCAQSAGTTSLGGSFPSLSRWPSFER